MGHQLHGHRNVETVGRRESSPILFDILRNFAFNGVDCRVCEESEEDNQRKSRTQQPVIAGLQFELHCFFGQTRKTEPTSVDKKTVQ
jgi:hypothetical protein